MDVKSKIKLYSNRVLITEDSENILPRWLRFVKGVVDTSDVDLNVSREMLQHNATLLKIRNAVTKRVLSELAKNPSTPPVKGTLAQPPAQAGAPFFRSSARRSQGEASGGEKACGQAGYPAEVVI